MNFPSIDIQGSILSNDLLGKIRSEQATFQQGKDFRPDFTNAKLKDDISLAWQEAKGQWAIFKSKLARLKEGEYGTTETRNFWISPLLTNLEYNLTYNRATEELNGKTFPIGYRDSTLDNFPLYIGGYNESLDKRPENKQLRVSPHAMLQEYLNYSEHLYGIVTNGRQLRLLRDASRITRLSYVEFNLEKMMEEDLYSDFVIFYRLMHASRMPRKIDAAAESIIEKYHQEGLEAGSTIRNKLGDAVKGNPKEYKKGAIELLANEFLNNPKNDKLRTVFNAGQLDSEEYYRQLLRIIYRLLFLFVIEERNLVYANSNTPATKRFNQIYFNYYSLLRLRRLSKKILPPEAERHYDLWQSLLSTFSLFEKKEIGEKLGIMSLQGDLFGYDAISNNHYDLHQCFLNNAVLLNIIKSLGYFENDNHVLIAVNYGGLDVEEFGSVYEGLLELKLNIKKVEGTEQYSCSFDRSNERGKSGSHYTPEELVQPLIKHSLDYLIEDCIKPYQQKKATKEQTVNALLGLKICDVACGSGHILLSAARRISLEIAWVRTDEEQPNPVALRKAMKDVVRNCIYGVDKNPLAVELCKIALWLEAYNPGEPLNFLDHHIKCGDAIVGLAHRKELDNGIADEAFKTLPGDDKDIAKSFRDRNIKERKAKNQVTLDNYSVINDEVKTVIEKYNLFKNLPETNPDEVDKKAKEHTKYEQDYHRIRLKQLADAQVAQFFIAKTDANKDGLITDAEYRTFLRQVNKHLGILQSNKLVKAQMVADKSNKNFFHWFLEFPEVFNEGGFDCVLGNPPFLGNRKITGTLGDAFLESVKYQFFPIGAVDLVTYFFRRIFDIIKNGGFQSLISTNTIAQGNAREDGLDVIVKMGGTINHAVKSMKWPGQAAVEVALVTITKQRWKGKYILSGNEVDIITPYLDNADTTGNPMLLRANENKSFQGSIVLGKGFILDKDEAASFMERDSRNKDVIFPYLNGEDLNNSPTQSPQRWIINFKDFPVDEASNYKDVFQKIKTEVKPQRDLVKRDAYRIFWWKYAERCPGLYEAVKDKSNVIAVAQVSKTLAFCLIPNNSVFSAKCIIFNLDQLTDFVYLQTAFHAEWAWKYGTTMKSDLSYGPVNIFQTFPFPQNNCKNFQTKKIGEQYHEHRRQLMLAMQLGLTKTYNAFHAQEIKQDINNTALQSLEKKSIEKQYGKAVWNLWNHLQKAPGTCSIEEAVAGIIQLRALHAQMDFAVLDAYGWQDIQLKHDFYEVDYLPENDCIRYTIHPDARKEVLKRLLALNHQIHEEEVKAGLWNKKEKKKVVEDVEDEELGGLFGRE